MLILRVRVCCCFCSCCFIFCHRRNTSIIVGKVCIRLPKRGDKRSRHGEASSASTRGEPGDHWNVPLVSPMIPLNSLGHRPLHIAVSAFLQARDIGNRIEHCGARWGLLCPTREPCADGARGRRTVQVCRLFPLVQDRDEGPCRARR